MKKEIWNVDSSHCLVTWPSLYLQFLKVTDTRLVIRKQFDISSTKIKSLRTRPKLTAMNKWILKLICLNCKAPDGCWLSPSMCWLCIKLKPTAAQVLEFFLEPRSWIYFLLKPNRDLMALMAFSLINDSSNLFNRGSNSSDVLRLARSGSLRILCWQ